MVDVLTLDPWGAYHFGIASITTTPATNIILHADSTNLTMERLD